MPPPRLIFRFFLLLPLFYALLLVPWPGFRDAYAHGLRAVATSLCAVLGGEASIILLRAHPEREAPLDTRIIVRAPQGQRRIGYSARRYGYYPTASVLALILATPVRWSRKWRALLWGLLLVHTFVLLRTVLIVLYALSPDGLGVFAWGRVLTRVVKLLAYIGRASSTSFVAAIFIWIIVAIRRSDWIHTEPARHPEPSASALD
ncbi:MAG: hypothetical protein KKB50_09910 [Planctomycetes bacterium]|nr:hypothetical protein [Planctomycetota bacterium]